MPIKRGNGARRGMHRGLEKTGKMARLDRRDNVVVAAARNNKSSAARTLAKLAEIVFKAIAHVACTSHVLPMEYADGALSLITTKLHKFLHYSLLLFLLARIANVIYICYLLIFEDFSTTTLVSLTFLIFYFFGGNYCCCNTWTSRETVQLVNSWRKVLEILGEVQERPVDMFEDVTLSMKVAVTGGLAVFGPLILPMLPLVFPDLPVSMQYQMKQVLPDMPGIWPQLICFPFELMASLIAWLNACFGICVLVIGIDLLNMFGQFMRRLPLNTAAQHEQMTHIYRFAKVYNAILDVWYKFVVPPALFMASATIVFCLFITFRHTELPTIVYCFYPYLAVLTLFIQFGLCYDGLVVINATRETVGRLRCRHTKCFRRMSQEDRAVGLRWAKGMKPVNFSVGSFTEFNVGVPLGVWDEILNQLMFLLTL